MILGFDIEVATFPTEEGQHWSEIAPLGITCAALSSEDGKSGMLWYSAPTRQVMSSAACEQMVRYLKHLVGKGHEIVTWNGMGFDWPVLGYEVGCMNGVTELALHTIDPMFGMFKSYGFPIGLDAAATGMGFAGKLEGMTGDKAVSMWKQPLQRPRVLKYVSQDARVTAQVATQLKATGQMHWIKKSGAPASRTLIYDYNYKYMKLPMADQSWMTGEPLRESQFIDWMAKT